MKIGESTGPSGSEEGKKLANHGRVGIRGGNPRQSQPRPWRPARESRLQARWSPRRWLLPGTQAASSPAARQREDRPPPPPLPASPVADVPQVLAPTGSKSTAGWLRAASELLRPPCLRPPLHKYSIASLTPLALSAGTLGAGTALQATEQLFPIGRLHSSFLSPSLVPALAALGSPPRNSTGSPGELHWSRRRKLAPIARSQGPRAPGGLSAQQHPRLYSYGLRGQRPI